MEKCYEYFACRQTECVMRNSGNNVKCWEMEETLCHSEHLQILERLHKDKCNYCIYHQQNGPRESDLL